MHATWTTKRKTRGGRVVERKGDKKGKPTPSKVLRLIPHPWPVDKPMVIKSPNHAEKEWAIENVDVINWYMKVAPTVVQEVINMWLADDEYRREKLFPEGGPELPIHEALELLHLDTAGQEITPAKPCCSRPWFLCDCYPTWWRITPIQEMTKLQLYSQGDPTICLSLYLNESPLSMERFATTFYEHVSAITGIRLYVRVAAGETINFEEFTDWEPVDVFELGF
jgi:(2Fe-2S) ferredoxin